MRKFALDRLTRGPSAVRGHMLAVEDAIAEIRSRRPFLVAGDETALAQLPEGRWIGGTIPYFMTDQGGQTCREKLFVQPLPDEVTSVKVMTYTAERLHEIPRDRFANGFSVVILPAFSSVHQHYADEASSFPGLFDQALVGWVAGVHLDDVDHATAKVFAGPQAFGDEAVVIHAQLPDGVTAVVNILNLFGRGGGPVLVFEKSGMAPERVLVDGEPRVFAEYLREIGHDMRLPLVGEYFGARANVAFRSVPDDDGPVTLWAPVFAGVIYRLGAPVGDYVTAFNEQMPVDVDPVFACNCILNYVYCDLEGRKTGDVTGPITFGEIAYELVNQTIVYLTIE